MAVGRVRYSERLWPATWLWVVMLALAVTAGVAMYPAGGMTAVVVGCAVGIAGVSALLVWWASGVRVVDVTRDGAGQPWLQAGDARIPVAALGAPVALREAAWRAELGPGLDVRSHRCVRGWVRHGVRVPVTDPRDPVPYWLVSSRNPERLCQALDGARRDPTG